MSVGTSSAPSDMVECAWQSTGFHAIRLRDLERVYRVAGSLAGRQNAWPRNRPRARGRVECLTHVERRRRTLLNRLGACDEVLGHNVGQTIGTREQPRCLIDVARRYALGTRPVRRDGLPAIDLGHE